MERTGRRWAAWGALTLGIALAKAAGAQECDPTTAGGCDGGQCLEYECSSAPLKRGFCEPSDGECARDAKDGTPCGDGMTCQRHTTALGVFSEDGGGFSCSATVVYCVNTPPPGSDPGPSSGTRPPSSGAGATSAGAAVGGSKGTESSESGSAGKASKGDGAGGKDSMDEGTTTTTTSDKQGDNSSCSVGRPRAGTAPALAAVAALVFVAMRRSRRA